jgi:hypothetical protein
MENKPVHFKIRDVMALDNMLCVHVDHYGAVTSCRGFHGFTTSNKAVDIRAVVESNPDPMREERKRLKEKLSKENQ